MVTVMLGHMTIDSSMDYARQCTNTCKHLVVQQASNKVQLQANKLTHLCC